MGRTIRALAFIFICTSLAWVILGSVTSLRTYDQDTKLREAVGKLWGTSQKQRAPEARVFRVLPERKVEVVVDGKRTVETKADTLREPVELAGSDINVDLMLEHRKKGLLWYSAYKVGFEANYILTNDTDEPYDYVFYYFFPTSEGIYENFRFTIDDAVVENLLPKAGVIERKFSIGPGESRSVNIAYESQGMDEWWYVFGENVSQINDFNLTMTTDFDDIDFPENTISASSKQKTDKGWELTWDYSNLISGIQIGMKMPQKLNPGPFVSRVSYFAPVSLFLFLFLMFIITSIKKMNIHPMNYFFIAASFFSFHLLLAYLADHIAIHIAFVICSIVSIALVIMYMRLVVGIRFALFETGLSQFVYLVLFSYAFFLEGYTGLAITICCILTLFAVMMLTGKTDWEKLYAESRKKNEISQ